MPAVFEQIHRVSADDPDVQGHVGNVRYVAWMQEAALGHSAAQGWPTERYQALDVAWVVRTHRIEYLKPAYAGDVLTVRTWVVDMKKTTSLRKFVFQRGADVIVRAETNWVFINTRRAMPTRILPEVRDAFEIVEGSQ